MKTKKIVTDKQMEKEFEKAYMFLKWQGGLSEQEARSQARKEMQEGFALEGSEEAKAILAAQEEARKAKG